MLSYDDWAKVIDYVGRALGRIPAEFDEAVVTKRDERKKLIWAEGYGSQPIPVVGYTYKGNVYDVQPTGNTTAVGTAVKSATVKTEVLMEPVVPAVGKTVLILRLMGQRRLARCIGEIKAKPQDYVTEVS